jgi:hypothetical protein
MKQGLIGLSMPRKIILTVGGVLYALAILGQARHGSMHMMIGVTLFFVTLVLVLFTWIK